MNSTPLLSTISCFLCFHIICLKNKNNFIEAKRRLHSNNVSQRNHDSIIY